MESPTNSSASNVFSALEILNKVPNPIGVTELGQSIGIPVSSAHRALATLEQSGFAVRYQSSSKWIPGPAGKQLAHSFFSRFHIRQLCVPYLRQLAYFTGETVSLSVRVTDQIVRIAYVSGTKDVVSHRPLGERRMFPDGTASRVLYAFIEGMSPQSYSKRPGLIDQTEIMLLEQEYAAIHTYKFALTPGSTLDTSEETSFAVLLNDRAIAAITIEGRLRGDDGSDPKTVINQTLSLIKNIEADAHAEGVTKSQFNPYDHLPASL